MHRLVLIAALLGLLAALCAPPAWAETATVTYTEVVLGRGASASVSTLYYTAAAGERNVVQVLRRPGGMLLTDGAGVSAGAGCEPTYAARGCAAPAGSVVVDLGDGDDSITIDPSPGSSFSSFSASGGPGDDRFNTTSVRPSETFVGGDGDDTFINGAVMDGGPGADRFLSGDTVSYTGRSEDLRVTVGAGPDDGAPGEGDDVGPGIRAVLGGSGNDVLIGEPRAPTGVIPELHGGPGNDRLLAGASDIALYGNAGSDVLVGSAGDDHLEGAPRDAAQPRSSRTPKPDAAGDALLGGGGDDVLLGGPGADRLDGEAGEDLLEGAGGADVLLGRDGRLT